MRCIGALLNARMVLGLFVAQSVGDWIAHHAHAIDTVPTSIETDAREFQRFIAKPLSCDREFCQLTTSRSLAYVTAAP